VTVAGGILKLELVMQFHKTNIITIYQFIEKKIFTNIFFMLLIIFWPPSIFAESLLSFDFKDNKIENGFDKWSYSDKGTNPCNVYNGINQSKLCTPNNFRFYIHFANYNNHHMGWRRYGYIDASSTLAVSGSALKIVQTGGVYPDGAGNVIQSGRVVTSKSDMIGVDNYSVLSDKTLPGDLGVYYKSDTSTNKIPELYGKNRLTLWLFMPRESSNFEKYNMKEKGRPDSRFSWYPFIGTSKAAHYYHHISNIAMGGWTKIQFDAHPTHNNAGNSRSYNAFNEGGKEYKGDGRSYFSNIAAFAFASKAMRNLTSPVAYYIDEVESSYVEYENEETINNVAVGYNPYTKQFDISLEDKYRCTKCKAQYELRYSFSPISNANFILARKVKNVVNFNRRDNNDNGKVIKSAPGYNQIWAAFNLQSEDNLKLNIGRKVYFALKDISNRGSINQDPLDFEKVFVPALGEIRKIDLIKTIDYKIIAVHIPLSIDPMIIKTLKMGREYTQNFTAHGGKPPYAFSTTNVLPEGLNLSNDGAIYGEPVKINNTIINIVVTDTNGKKATKGFSFKINHISDFDVAKCAPLVDFGKSANHNIIELSAYSKVIKDVYTGYDKFGTTITIGSNGHYNYQGIEGEGHHFEIGDSIRSVWFNNSDQAIKFTPYISLSSAGRPDLRDLDNWHPMGPIIIKANEFEVSTFNISKNTDGRARVVNISVNYNNSKVLILDKLEYVSKKGNPDNICRLPALKSSFKVKEPRQL
jgi:hypothetical protein